MRKKLLRKSSLKIKINILKIWFILKTQSTNRARNPINFFQLLPYARININLVVKAVAGGLKPKIKLKKLKKVKLMKSVKKFLDLKWNFLA